jgi:hypothetical protein
MTTVPRVDLDDLLRDISAVGFGALLLWVLIGTVGIVSGSLQIDAHQTLRFLAAVLIVSFARRTYRELVEWRWRGVPPEERYGFARPLRETPRSNEHTESSKGEG